MSDGESASVQFFEDETEDEDTIDFHTEVDNQSIISRNPRGASPAVLAMQHAAPPAPSSGVKQPHPAVAVPSIPLVSSVTKPSGNQNGPHADARSSSDSSSEDGDAEPSPRMMATSTGKISHVSEHGGGGGGRKSNSSASSEKKTVVTATLRARAASQSRGRSPNVLTPEPNIPRSVHTVPQPFVTNAAASQPVPRSTGTASPPADSLANTATPATGLLNAPMGSTATFDAAGVAALMQFLQASQQPAVTPSVAPQPTTAAQAIENAHIATLNYETLQRHIRQQEAPATSAAVAASAPAAATAAAAVPSPSGQLQQSPGLTPQLLANSRARRIAASNDIVALAPPAELADDAREEAARITLGWYRDFNGEQRKQLQALEARVREEKFALESDKMAFKDRIAAEAQRRTDVSNEHEQMHTALRANKKIAATARAASASAAPRGGSRGEHAPASGRGASGAAPSPRVQSPPQPVALEPSLEAVARGVASRYGVVLPAQSLTGGTDTAIALPDRLFFATGVQLTRDQRNELLSRMREAIRLRGAGASAAHAVGPVPWLAPVDTDLGSRAASLPRVALDSRARMSLSPPRGVNSLTGAAARGSTTPPDGVPRAVGAADWAPFTGPMRQRTREGGPAALPKQTSTQQRVVDAGGQRPRKRTEVLRELFLLLDVRERRMLRRSELELLYHDLTADAENGGQRADDLRYAKSSARLQRDVTLRFVADLVLPLLLLSGFEEFDFPLFSQIILRMADKEALPSDFAFQPTAQSPLATKARKGDTTSAREVDVATTSEGVRSYLRSLCALPTA